MRPAISTFLLLSFLLIGAAARGQTSPCPDHPLFGTLAYKTLEGPQTIAVGDLNGDGVTDLVVGTSLIPFSSSPGHSVSIMLGTGDGRMGPATDLPFAATIESVALGDLDGDGDLDVAAAFGNVVAVLINDGSGTFFVDATYFSGTGCDDVVLGDIDEDGDVDVITSTDSALVIHPNDGGGGLLPPTTVTRSGGWPHGLTTGDVDGDGHLDLVSFAWGSGNLEIRHGDGTLNGTATAAPQIVSGTSFYDAALGDLNGDGLLDVVGVTGSAVVTYLSDGVGGFVGNTPSGVDAYDVAVGDVEGDGDVDVVVTAYGERAFVLENPGSGILCPTGCLGQDYYSGSDPRDMALADLDGNGALDILVANFQDDAVHAILGKAGGGYNAPRRVWQPTQTEGLGLADMDLDGDLDLLMPTPGSSSVPSGVFVQANQGGGNWGTALHLPSMVGATSRVAVGDFDADGWPDIAASGSGVAVFRNQALTGAEGGSFDPAVTYSQPGYVSQLKLGDMDGDGDSDLVMSFGTTVAGNTNLSLLMNQGLSSGTFSQVPSAPPISLNCVCNYSLPFALLDANSDGTLDVAIRNYDEISILTNDGAGLLTVPTLPQISLPSGAANIASGDLNGDGLLDLVAIAASHGIAVMLQGAAPAGTVSFSSPLLHTIPDSSSAVGLILTDFNGDGNLDVAFATANVSFVGVLLGDGAGGLGPVQLYGAGWDPVQVQAGDLDGDGALDLVTRATNRITILDGCPFAQPSFPALGEDLQLATGPAAALTFGPGFDRKTVSVGTTLGIAVTSPGGTYQNDPLIIGLQFFGVPDPSPGQILPGLWLDFTSAGFAILLNGAATPIPVVPGPAGFTLSAALAPGLVGQSILVQAVTLSPLPTSFYGFALSPAHLITFAP